MPCWYNNIECIPTSRKKWEIYPTRLNTTFVLWKCLACVDITNITKFKENSSKKKNKFIRKICFTHNYMFHGHVCSSTIGSLILGGCIDWFLYIYSLRIVGRVEVHHLNLRYSFVFCYIQTNVSGLVHLA